MPADPASPAHKLSLVCEIAVTYVITRWTLPRGDLRDVTSASRAALRGAPGGAQPDPSAVSPREVVASPSGAIALHLGRAVARTLRRVPTDSRCLVQSLVLTRLLSARGIPSTLVIGAHSNPDFTAHAWVEYGGVPILPHWGYRDSRLLEL